MKFKKVVFKYEKKSFWILESKNHNRFSWNLIEWEAAQVIRIFIYEFILLHKKRYIIILPGFNLLSFFSYRRKSFRLALIQVNISQFPDRNTKMVTVERDNMVLADL